MRKKQTVFDRRRILLAAAVLSCIVLLIAGAVALASCQKNEQSTTTQTKQSQASTSASAETSAAFPTAGTTTEQSSADTSTVQPSTGTPTSETPTSETPTGTPSGETPTDTPTPPEEETAAYISPSSISVKDGKIYVADATGRSICRLSGDGKKEKEAQIGAPVSKILAENGKVYALAGERNGSFLIFDEELNKEKSIMVGHTPTDLYINGQTAYVCNRFSNTVSVIDLARGKVTGGIPVLREPVCMAAANGVLYVGSRLQDGSSLAQSVSSKIVKIDMSKNEAVGSISLQDGATNVRGMAVSPDGSKIYVTHTVARYAFPTTQLDRGWVNTNGFSVIDTSTGTSTAFLLDDVEKGAANPWDVETADNGLALYFSISGTGELIKLDVSKMNNRILSISAGLFPDMTSVDQAIDHVEFLSGLKTRITLEGEGVRDIAVENGRIYAAEYFSGTVSVVDEKTMTKETVISIGEQPEKTEARIGEALWCDATYCYQTWESCSSCHPDARPDGLNWDEGGDGWGTPKNTKSMMFSFRTPPVLATGCVDDAEGNVIGTVREAFHSMLEEEKVECMNAYLRSLLPVESPYLAEDGGYTESALRGKELFTSAGCAACHPAPLYTDLQFHKSPYLGTDGSWEDRAFITPTLVEIWRSAPYTYCGCETDLKEVIKKFARTTLTEEQLADLEQFLMSIGTVGEDAGVVQVFFDKDGTVTSGALLPGSTLKTLTLIGQSKTTVSGAAVKITLTDDAGARISEKELSAGDLPYGVLKTLEVNADVPGNIKKGAYLTVSILDDRGVEISTPLKLICQG